MFPEEKYTESEETASHLLEVPLLDSILNKTREKQPYTGANAEISFLHAK